jgi:hypothetical protein
MTPQTTFANGVNPWAGTAPSTVIQRPTQPAPRSHKTKGLRIEKLAAPRVGGTFLTRCGRVVSIDSQSSADHFLGHEAAAPDMRHKWQASGRWGGYTKPTPYDLMRELTHTKKRKRPVGKYDDMFHNLVAGRHLPVPPGAAKRVQASLRAYLESLNYVGTKLRRSDIENWVLIESFGTKLSV